ncbi:MAG TPA: 3-phosphoshikimate 1-carboxyvinyltransferase [Pyrinomonadaceae bacterium]|nr:3-phosphoshikimate 1-carboxyvinyltransferase [Pyrinomonadaceae bacterium]
MRIRPAHRINGALSLPGDKAISHRAAIISALARGTSHIENFSTGDDCAATVSCLRDLGVSVEFEAGGLRIEGVGLEGLRAPRSKLDCRNSGSTIRMLSGVLAGQNFESTLTGDESLQARPMRRIIEPLQLMGARVASREGYSAPLHITGRVPLKAVSYEMPVASAQVKSCILLAGLYAKGQTHVIEARARTRDHTERMLRWYGASVTVGASQDEHALSNTITIEPPLQLRGRDFRIPGDISSAAFFIAAACLLPGSKFSVLGVGLNPTRTQFLSTLRSLGADVRAETSVDSRGRWMELDEPCGIITVRGGAGLAPIKQHESNVVRGALIPQLIDELPMLAVLGTQVMGGFSIRDAGELRLKETDRIAATAENLRAMGVEVEEHEDGLTIRKRTHLSGAKLKTHNDHRIAMAFSVAALLAEGDSEIEGAECVSVSFPEFYTLLESVVER